VRENGFCWESNQGPICSHKLLDLKSLVGIIHRIITQEIIIYVIYTQLFPLYLTTYDGTQRDSSLSVLPVARVQFPATVEYFKGFSPG